ncbi:EAL domain-containing protein [Vibrio hippocampi]|uniref:Diguanylate cyclase n=1 Tax=Vibrio hippocampi TaxID=654686 RepID=A0ABN8DLP9_9VIBR|nr:EAL domain-containing protein [Vibrio hippocampi]CAH0530392.1 hypothetical protein VHP8226_04035 [Vibrio hippocampi]
MTLFRQLVVGMIAVFIMLLVSVFVIEFNTTRNFLEQQQRSEVNNTINTVGLALAPYLQDKDPVAVESVINALFDGSTYSTVRLVFLDNNQEIIRRYPIAPNDVPSWFSHLELFKPIMDSRVVTSGWLQLAQIEIISHPGSAYSQLWHAFKNLALVFVAILLLGLVAISWILRRALKPLNAIVKKMDQVANKQFGQPLERPNTKDLIAVVDGINSMSKHLEISFSLQAKEAQQLRERAYMDSVSQLGNRAYFTAQLEQWLSESSLGGLAILDAQFVKEAYKDQGYHAGDELVKELSDLLSVTINIPNCTIARISSNEFGFIFPNIDQDELKMVASAIVSCIQDMSSDPTGLSKAQASLGVVYSQEHKDSSQMLSTLDNALTEAKSNPEIDYGYISSQTHATTLGKQQWRMVVEEAINNDWVQFRFQAANSKSGDIFHKEVFSSIDTGEQRYTANQYLLALEQLGASQLFDEHVIQSVIKVLERDDTADPIAINIAASSLEQPSFIRWISSVLNKHRRITHKLHFEIPEICFVDNPDNTALFCHALRSAGAKFGVDNYGRHFKSLAYLNEFRPDYVKLDYLYTHHLDDEKQKFTLSSVSRTAHNLSITTIASRVETQTQLDLLSEHFVDIFQGFIVDK